MAGYLPLRDLHRVCVVSLLLSMGAAELEQHLTFMGGLGVLKGGDGHACRLFEEEMR